MITDISIFFLSKGLKVNVVLIIILRGLMYKNINDSNYAQIS